jgi:hypothetical protein
MFPYDQGLYAAAATPQRSIADVLRTFETIQTVCMQLATLISAVAAAGRKNNANGEFAAHLAELKKSEALWASQAPEIRRFTRSNVASGQRFRGRQRSQRALGGFRFL